MHSITHWVKEIYGATQRNLPGTLKHYASKQFRIPAFCGLCSQIHLGRQAICKACLDQLTPIRDACETCGLPLSPSQMMTCGQCIQKKPALDYTFAPFVFDELLRHLLHEFKYHQGLYLTSFLAHLILDNLPKAALETECLIPVPSHQTRLRQRGFNHAAQLAKLMGKSLNIPYDLYRCKKIIHTPAQAQLNAAERKNNLRNAFQVPDLHLTRITIIDDLYTTGSTANELAKTLKQHGAAHVSLWCCARVIEDSASV